MSFDPATYTAYAPSVGGPNSPVVFYVEIKYFDSTNALTTYREVVKPPGAISLEATHIGDEGQRLYSESALLSAQYLVRDLVEKEFVVLDGLEINRDRIYSVETKVLALEPDGSGGYVPA